MCSRGTGQRLFQTVTIGEQFTFYGPTSIFSGVTTRHDVAGVDIGSLLRRDDGSTGRRCGSLSAARGLACRRGAGRFDRAHSVQRPQSTTTTTSSGPDRSRRTRPHRRIATRTAADSSARRTRKCSDPFSPSELRSLREFGAATVFHGSFGRADAWTIRRPDARRVCRNSVGGNRSSVDLTETPC